MYRLVMTFYYVLVIHFIVELATSSTAILPINNAGPFNLLCANVAQVLS